MRRLIRIMLKAATAVRRHCAALAEAPRAVSEKRLERRPHCLKVIVILRPPL